MPAIAVTVSKSRPRKEHLMDILNDQDVKKTSAVEGSETRKFSGLFERQAFEATRVNYVTPERYSFTDRDGFLTMTDKNRGGEPERVTLHLLFPYSSRRKLVSVLNGAQEEIGLIADIDAFGGDDLSAIEKEIGRKYFIRTITRILGIKDKNGITTWRVGEKTDDAEEVSEFTLKDTYGSIFKIDEKRLLITDQDGNRYEIPDVTALDKKSARKIELYL